MPGRRLDAEERALWRKVTASVRPLRTRDAAPVPEELADAAAGVEGKAGVLPSPLRLEPAPRRTKTGGAAPPADTLDGGWDRRLRRGMVAPERSIDLHGHTLASAHAALDAALDRAIAEDARLLLLVTGRPPRPGERRGAIRAAVGDWLAASRHASRIAAVRNAHPRHGGAGALYVILRRRRERG